MNRAKRMGYFALAVGMMLSVAACSSAKKSEKSLYEQGLEVIDIMSKMACSEDYISLMCRDAEMISLLRDAGIGSSSEPKAVYCVTTSSSALWQLIGEEAGESVKLSSTLQEELVKRVTNVVATKANAEVGDYALAAANICTAGKLFVDEEVTENMLYIYTYEDGYPAAVTFIPGEDGAVSASGMYILNEDFAEDPEEYLDECINAIGIEMEEVKMR